MSTAIPIAQRLLGGDNSLYLVDPQANAVSREAEEVARDTRKVSGTIERSEALFGRKAAAISQLKTLCDECGEENWDGNGAKALDSLAVCFAERFIRVLPSSLPIPEFSIEPDGSVSLDWIGSRTRVFSVSVGSNWRLAYAWLDGSDRGHAVARFDGKVVPQRILEGIRAVVKSA